MPAERGLNQSGIFGKHPGFGDFLSAGELSADGPRQIIDWLANILGIWREGAGADWQHIFDQGPPLHFWIGAGLLNGQGLRGTLIPSRDKTGRRFPLVVAQGPAGPAPFVEPDQQFYDLAAAELQRLRETSHFEPRETAAHLTATLPPAPDVAQPTGASFWATNPSHTPQDLLNELAGTEMAHAQAARSYWWFAHSETTPSGLLACPGWPGAAEIGWLLGAGRGHGQQSGAAANEAPA